MLCWVQEIILLLSCGEGLYVMVANYVTLFFYKNVFYKNIEHAENENRSRKR